MGLFVGDVMQVNVETVSPELSLTEFNQRMTEAGISGCPVVDGDQLVGVVSRTDILRALSQERSLAERTSDFYFDELGFHEVRIESFNQIADRVGERFRSLAVRDIMSHNPIVVEPTEDIEDAARLMLQQQVHRLPVSDGGRLVGIITSMDLVQLFADRRVHTKE